MTVVGSEKHLKRSKVFCMAPWAHLHVLTNGKVFPCCVSGHDTENAVADLRTGDTLETAWNSERMRALRRNMLAGTPSRLCERCYTNESLGLDSFRTNENEQLAHHYSWVERTDDTGRLGELHLPYLDLRVSNLCNLKCRICCHQYSTSWYGDAVKLGQLLPSQPALVVAVDDTEALFEQLRPLLPTLEHIHFAGGEPLIMPEHYRLMDELAAIGKTDLRVSYNTNFSLLRYKTYDAVALWKNFRSVDVSASLDGMGARGDYMRKGQQWDRIEANRERLLRECPHVDFQIAATVSLMNVLHMPDFFRDWHQKGYITPNRMKMNLLFEPEYYNVRGLPHGLKRRVEDLYGRFIEDYLEPLGDTAGELVTNFQAIVTYMNEADVDVVGEFRRVTKELDVIRGESFANIFPELAEFVAPTTLVDLVERARAKRKLGDTEGSLRDYDEAATHDGCPAEVYTERGTLRFERGALKKAQGDAAGALEDFNLALELDPRQFKAYLNRGVLLRELGRPIEALKDLQVALEHVDELVPRGRGQWPLYLERGRVRRTCGDLDGALADYTHALMLAPDSPHMPPDLLTERGSIRRAIGDSTGARSDYDEVIRRHPQDARAHLERGRLTRESGDLGGALADLDRAHTLARSESPGHTMLALSERSSLKRAMGDDVGALHDLTALVALGPTQSLPYIEQGIAAIDEPSQSYPKALVPVFDPADPATPSRLRYARGVARHHLGDQDGGLQDFDKALELAPATDATLRQFVERMR